MCALYLFNYIKQAHICGVYEMDLRITSNLVVSFKGVSGDKDIILWFLAPQMIFPLIQFI